MTYPSVYTPLYSSTGLPYPNVYTPLYGSTGLPPGMSLSPSGVLSGTPTTAGTYTVQLYLTDANGVRAGKVFVITVGAGALIISPSVLPAGQVGVPYAATFTAALPTADNLADEAGAFLLDEAGAALAGEAGP